MNTETRLKQERLNRRWTQEDIARKLGISKQTVCNWEKGRRFPRRPVLDNLEKLFGLNYRELFAPVSDEDPCSSTN
ncbi:helix-turn-helix transcriptional regulator [Sinanaerobacter sp. ZZT-01]|uniref:helix-turn-helix transcriptional regulator n=1 Tax=Sinanaerobacter sp. ZZT-01 TaxID=3111540 RepID=UPI002D79A845|nr:helix-turn-helix transcriptional regulator [Sinanaerobacter sp. ZZT-01]WRR94229.1 helix-turn-helix transcriptional regulator [Sinanaerobacter sp. ZZT-01]